MNTIWSDKKIVLGVCGSIAAYKAAQLARDLTLKVAQVDVVMTESAQRFIGAATFQAVTGRPVLTSLWDLPEDGHVGHVSLGAQADLVIIAPATANTIARVAAGVCDDLLTTTVLATRAPILIAPAMNPNMLDNAITQTNIAALRSRGMRVLEPDYGRMAENVIGKGRMPEPEALLAHTGALLGQTYGALRGTKVVVTAGGTREPIDPVRHIGNRASGRMGYALAEEARDLGADVTLISGPAEVKPPGAITFVQVETALQMREAVLSAVQDAHLLIMNAAVADFRPVAVSDHKIKKGDDDHLTITLTKNPDILGELAPRRNFVKIGFAAETRDLVDYAQSKLKQKGLDMIVANDAIASIGAEDIQLTMIDEHSIERLDKMAKPEAAHALMQAIVARFKSRFKSQES
jgi:phosphopantothenoylcysteine decarboxylase/phosphopantothenate--cysteine ligase